jgi:hypothetical protein
VAGLSSGDVHLDGKPCAYIDVLPISAHSAMLRVSMASVSPKVDEAHGPDVPVEDEEDMTSIMSAEQRKALQQAAKTEKESATLERDTAKPPPSDARAVNIPRAAAVPAEAREVEQPRAAAPAAELEPEPTARPAPTAAADPKGAGWATWEFVAFVLLAAAIVAALRF